MTIESNSETSTTDPYEALFDAVRAQGLLSHNATPDGRVFISGQQIGRVDRMDAQDHLMQAIYSLTAYKVVTEGKNARENKLLSRLTQIISEHEGQSADAARAVAQNLLRSGVYSLDD